MAHMDMSDFDVLTENGVENSAEQREIPRVDELIKYYDPSFRVDAHYKQTLPDLQNGRNNSPAVEIQHVGIGNFKIPLMIKTRRGDSLQVHASVTGTVSLESHKKGINMSRIIRTFYEYEEDELHPENLQRVVRAYLEKLETSSARIAIKFDYPVRQKSLRSGLSGYQYYPLVLETVITPDHKIRQFMHLKFEYSSACPCSYELSVHANVQRSVAAVPHSQRSVARISLEYVGHLWIEDVIDICRDSLKTETQVMVKREDEQAFAELNAAYLKFVEDAVRLLYNGLNSDPQIVDFRVHAAHLESLHSHDAISILVKGVPGGFQPCFDPFQ